DLRCLRPSDIGTGLISARRSLNARRPRRNALWRYWPEIIERLTERYQECYPHLPDHDVDLQFGVAGVVSTPMVAHIEMSVTQAIENTVYARTYGLNEKNERPLTRAIEGELIFLERCALVWTNSRWTAKGLIAQGVPEAKIRVCPPACGLADPG